MISSTLVLQELLVLIVQQSESEAVVWWEISIRSNCPQQNVKSRWTPTLGSKNKKVNMYAWSFFTLYKDI